MKLHFDKEADALYLRLDESKIVESEEVQPGVVLDFNKADQIVGIELPGLGKRVPLEAADLFVIPAKAGIQLIDLTGFLPARERRLRINQHIPNTVRDKR